MQTIHFIGRILPDAIRVSIPFRPIVKWEEELGLVFNFKFNITESNIDIECELPKYQPEMLVPLYMRAFDLCRAQVDLVAFKSGVALTVFLDKLIDPQGIQTSLVGQNNELSDLCNAFELDIGFDEICTQVMQSQSLFMALRDLVSSISLPHVSVVDCARAMERLKHHLVSNSRLHDSEAWQQFRTILRIDKAYIKFITDHSVNSRHGRPIHISGEITTEVIRRSWIIMNRYLNYLKNGKIPLSENDYPILAGK